MGKPSIAAVDGEQNNCPGDDRLEVDLTTPFAIDDVCSKISALPAIDLVRLKMSRSNGATGVRNNRPTESEVFQLPVVDLGGLASGDPAERQRIAKAICEAMGEWGFFQAINHGVSSKLIGNVEEQAREFFDLPLDLKKRVEVVGPNPRLQGYKTIFAKDDEYRTIPVKEFLAGYRFDDAPVSALAARIWPDGNPAFSNALEEHARRLEALGHTLLELLAESVGLKSDFYAKNFQKGADCIPSWRLHYVPPNTMGLPFEVWRTPPHTDPSVLTILRQDVEGLQVKKPGQNTWIDIFPLPGSFVVNVGDTLEAWSNGRFPSVEHCVRVSGEGDRFSTINFLDAGPSMAIEAPPELIDDDHPALYRPFSAGDFRVHFEKTKRIGDITKGVALDYFRNRSE